ncbi:hypothetical protein FB451DRAFT_1412451 [Mycena latifolia]|nr:hypothetical protein FB451DRAFT_1412451 [Mycena latifolia]
MPVITRFPLCLAKVQISVQTWSTVPMIRNSYALLRRDPPGSHAELKGHIDGKRYLRPLTDRSGHASSPPLSPSSTSPMTRTPLSSSPKSSPRASATPRLHPTPLRDSFIFRGPLKLELKIEERAPTMEGFRAIAAFLQVPSFHSFLPTRSTHWPTGAAAFAAAALA